MTGGWGPLSLRTCPLVPAEIAFDLFEPQARTIHALAASLTRTYGIYLWTAPSSKLISMRGIPLRLFVANTARRKSMSNTSRKTFSMKHLFGVCGALFISGALLLLSGCQGVSANNSQPAPGALGSNPTALSFGDVTVGHNQLLSLTISNSGASSVTISQVQISGNAFTQSGITAPLTLDPGTNVTMSVTFTPTAAGNATGTLTLTSNASNPTLTVALSGTGTTTAGQLGVSPGTIAVGDVVVGTSGTASGNLNATGANVTVTGASTNNTAFVVSGVSLPLTILAGQSSPFTVTFSPSTTGTASATLTFTSNAQPATATATLTGNGTPAPVHSVNLSWNASTSSNISGYNIYRAVYTTSCGSFSKINSLLNTGTLYTDAAVTDGSSYCYAATAVNTSNAESGYSNIVSNIQIPAP